MPRADYTRLRAPRSVAGSDRVRLAEPGLSREEPGARASRTRAPGGVLGGGGDDADVARPRRPVCAEARRDLRARADRAQHAQQLDGDGRGELGTVASRPAGGGDQLPKPSSMKLSPYPGGARYAAICAASCESVASPGSRATGTQVAIRRRQRGPRHAPARRRSSRTRATCSGVTRLSTTSSAVGGRHARHLRPEGGDRDRGVSAAAGAGEIRARARARRRSRPARRRVSRAMPAPSRACAAPGPSTARSCQPLTIAGLDAPSARSAWAPVSVVTDDRPSASATGLRTLTARGPIFSRSPGACRPDGGGEREGIERRHLADPHRVEATAPAPATAMSIDLRLRAIQPERRDDLEILDPQAGAGRHSCAMLVGRSSSRRPAISQLAGLTWKCAVAVWASRKRRCSGESS